MAETINTQATSSYRSIALPVSDLPVALGYTGSNVTTFTVVYTGISVTTGLAVDPVTYVQTLSYSGSNPTNFSRWVPQ